MASDPESLRSTGATLGLIAGRGQFPFLTARGARGRGMRVAAVGFHGHTDPALAGECDAFVMLHLGRVGRMIRFLQREGAGPVALAGAIHKPRAMQIRPDLRAMRLLFSHNAKGDDALLRRFLAELETEGFTPVQAADLVPDLRAPEGVLSAREPSAEEWEDLRMGWDAAKRMGGLDVGQCVVLKRGIVTAVEAVEGTDEAVRRGTALGGPGCVVVKVVKPGQDERMDLPSAGLETLRTMAAGRAACLGLEAGKSLFFDMQESLELAAREHIAVVGLSPGVLDQSG
jgi:hypothetical protein